MDLKNLKKFFKFFPIKKKVYLVLSLFGAFWETVIERSETGRKRAMGRDVYFQTGTDEHGQKIADSATADGVNFFVLNATADKSQIANNKSQVTNNK